MNFHKYTMHLIRDRSHAGGYSLSWAMWMLQSILTAVIRGQWWKERTVAQRNVTEDLIKKRRQSLVLYRHRIGIWQTDSFPLNNWSQTTSFVLCRHYNACHSYYQLGIFRAPFTSDFRRLICIFVSGDTWSVVYISQGRAGREVVTGCVSQAQGRQGRPGQNLLHVSSPHISDH